MDSQEQRKLDEGTGVCTQDFWIIGPVLSKKTEKPFKKFLKIHIP